MGRKAGTLLAVVVGLLAPAAAVSPAVAREGAAGVSVTGTVSTPTTYSLAGLAALPSETVQVPVPTHHGNRQVPVTGVSLESLVTLAGPELPAAKNAALRIVVTVVGRDDRAVTFAGAELDPNFGNHDGVLALAIDGRRLPSAPDLVVPGDASFDRSVLEVRKITVAVESPAVVTPPSPGAIELEAGTHSVVLSASTLADLPPRTLSVSFLAGTAPQQHSEVGPTLSEVLARAHLPVGPTTWVGAVGSDGYVAVVTPAEASVGGRPLLMSVNEDGVALSQPRLIVDGDVKGARYVSGVEDLVIGTGGGAIDRP